MGWSVLYCLTPVSIASAVYHSCGKCVFRLVSLPNNSAVAASIRGLASQYELFPSLSAVGRRTPARSVRLKRWQRSTGSVTGNRRFVTGRRENNSPQKHGSPWSILPRDEFWAGRHVSGSRNALHDESYVRRLSTWVSIRSSPNYQVICRCA